MGFLSIMSGMEWVGFLTGVLCVYLLVRERDVNWPIGVVNSLALLYVFWGYGLYAQVGLQVFYVFECLYGWWKWTRRDPQGNKVVVIARTPRGLALALTALFALGTAACWLVLARTNDPAPFWDGAISSASLVAEYMLCLKLTEGWVVYFVADLVSLVVLAVLGQWVTFGTYACFTLLCLAGVREWWNKLPGDSARS